MADCKKYNGSTWEHSLRKLTTATDTITTLPAVVYPNATTATVGLKGNMSQSGTPTPDNPIMPQGTGERTGNLFDGSLYNGVYRDVNFNIMPTSIDVYKCCKIYLNSGTYTLSFSKAVRIVRLIINKTYAENVAENVTNYTFTVNNDSYFGITFRDETSSSTVWDNSPIMLNSGSAALPYEPYGIKIPISSASTTTPVYLGEVETTRRIKKLVLTGEETSYMVIDTSKNIFSIRGVFNQAPELLQVGGFCTHYKYNNVISSLSQNMSNGDFVLNKIVNDYSFTIKDNSFSTETEFQQYLQQQYANGTPVTVWYVLATPTTGILNEPLRKIGNYADEVSGISIPTIAGANSFDVLTTLKPSEVTANYHGWHTGAVHERDSGQWD